MMVFFFSLFYFCVFFNVMVHSLSSLVFVEFLVLFGFYFLFCNGGFVSSLLFLLISVCMGAYSVSVFVDLVRLNGSPYLLSFSNLY